MNLFISTASQNLIICVFDDQSNIIKNVFYTGKNNHSEVMMPIIEETLKDLEIKKIYVVNGPGSYTGLRVAMTFAKTYSYLKNIDLYLINYLDAIYHTYNTNVAIDAKGKKFFAYDGETLVLTDQVEGYLIDQELDIEVLVKQNYFDKIEKIDPKLAGINYVKSAI